jgi:hypothetical protein
VALAIGSGVAVAGCAAPWARPAERLPIVPLPSATPARSGTPTLRFVLSQEGVPALDNAVKQATLDAGRQLGLAVEPQGLDDFLGTTGGSSSGEGVAHRLLVAVQAGVPPDALLLAGRQAQTARLHAMDLVQDVSALLRTTRQRYGSVAPITEVWHVVAGTWFAVPFYQRLVGHWMRGAVAHAAGVDPNSEGTRLETLARALLDLPGDFASGSTGATAMGTTFWPWGIGSADTADVDAWCWDVIHAFGGALADAKGERVQLASPETAAALAWMERTLADLAARDRLPRGTEDWSDPQKNAAFAAGATGYTYTQQLLSPSPAVSAGDAVYLTAPGGPVNRPRATGGGAAWYVPRDAPAPLVERLLEQLSAPAAQQMLWQSGGGAALPVYEAGWSESAIRPLLGDSNVARFRQEVSGVGLVSATGNAGPETAASQAIGEARLGAAMLRAVADGRTVEQVLAEAQASAVGVFRDFGLPGQ